MIDLNSIHKCQCSCKDSTSIPVREDSRRLAQCSFLSIADKTTVGHLNEIIHRERCCCSWPKTLADELALSGHRAGEHANSLLVGEPAFRGFPPTWTAYAVGVRQWSQH